MKTRHRLRGKVTYFFHTRKQSDKLLLLLHGLTDYLIGWHMHNKSRSCELFNNTL